MTRERPYANIDSSEGVSQAIVDGVLPQCPAFNGNTVDNNIGKYLWKICAACWKMDPMDRPLMGRISDRMETFGGHLVSDPSKHYPEILLEQLPDKNLNDQLEVDEMGEISIEMSGFFYQGVLHINGRRDKVSVKRYKKNKVCCQLNCILFLTRI